MKLYGKFKHTNTPQCIYIFQLLLNSYSDMLYKANKYTYVFLTTFNQGWRQKFSDRGAGAADRGAKMTEK